MSYIYDISNLRVKCCRQAGEYRKPVSEAHLKIENFTFENVENFNYLGSILNADNKMNIEIAEKK
jgi:hypothetical protein